MQELNENNFLSGVMAARAQELTPHQQLIELGLYLKATNAKEYTVSVFKDNVVIGRFVWTPNNNI